MDEYFIYEQPIGVLYKWEPNKQAYEKFLEDLPFIEDVKSLLERYSKVNKKKVELEIFGYESQDYMHFNYI